MATTTLGETTVHTTGELPQVGSAAPPFSLVGTDLGDVTSESLAGRRVVLNIFPSVDTRTCATSVRRFNELAAGLENTTVVCASEDLPFAQARFCGAEGIEDVVMGSSFRCGFGEDYGLTMTNGRMQGLLARAVVVLDESGTVVHTELVPTIGQEPDYDAAVAALR